MRDYGGRPLCARSARSDSSSGGHGSGSEGGGVGSGKGGGSGSPGEGGGGVICVGGGVTAPALLLKVGPGTPSRKAKYQGR